MLKRRFSRKFLLRVSQLLLIAILWLGGVYIFEIINKTNILPHTLHTSVQADGNVNVWWPTNNARISDTQTFKGLVQDKKLGDYKMYWQVDGGQLNEMWDSQTDHPHKEATVNLSGWKWKGAGPYKVTFVAKDHSGNKIGEFSADVFTSNGETVKAATVQQPAQQTVSSTQQTTSSVTIQNAPTATQTVPPEVNVWWPKNNVTVTGQQPFKAAVPGRAVDNYKMYWQVDGGQWNEMQTNNTDGPHKEVLVNLGGWNWKGAGPYKITFVARNNNGIELDRSDITVFTGTNSGTVQTTVLAKPTQTTTQTQPQPVTQVVAPVIAPVVNVSSNSGNPFGGEKFYLNPNTDPKRTADSWRSSRPADAAQMDKIGNTPVVEWLGDWNSDVQSFTQQKVSEMKAQGALPVFVAYNIPSRDCGQYSSGGANNPDGYRNWIRGIANGIGNNKAVVILEPDGITLTDCLGSRAGERYGLIKDAVAILKSKPNISVYIDAGHSGWLSAEETAKRLNQSGIQQANGFALNVSNFQTTGNSTAFGQNVSKLVGNKHFVIDTGRNGVGPTGDNQWCNPPGRALGNKPTTNTGNSLVDAYLWVKGPGGSDGSCNGAPPAGQWFESYALDMARRSAQ